MGALDAVWLAVALLFVIEGLMPFFAPALWRRMMEHLMQQGERAIRRFGFLSIAIGLLMLWLH